MARQSPRPPVGLGIWPSRKSGSQVAMQVPGGTLLDRWGARSGDLETIHLAGAFGNYMNVASARRIGLLEADAAAIEPAGNTSLRGARMALLSASRRDARIAGSLPCVAASM